MSYKPDGRLPNFRRQMPDYDEHNINVKEIGMSMQSEGKDAKGRNYDQVTKNGTSSAATMGTGGTGDIGRMSGDADAGNRQSDVRSDDLLSPDAEQEGKQGYRPGNPEAIKTGMEGIADLNGSKSGNRQ